MLKLKMMLCVMMLPLVVVGCTSAVCQSVREATTPPAWIMQPPPDWQTPLNGIISPSERGWSLCKNNWKEPRSILMSSADRVAYIDGQLMQLLWAIHTRFQRSINAKVIKPSNPFTNVCWVSVLTTFSAPPQILAARQFSSAQFQKRRNDGWWFLVLLLPVCFEQ